MRFGIFIYDGVEPIDLATFGVLSMARRIAPEISICTIAPSCRLRRAREWTEGDGRLRHRRRAGLQRRHRHRRPGWTAQANAPATLDYIRRVHASSPHRLGLHRWHDPRGERRARRRVGDDQDRGRAAGDVADRGDARDLSDIDVREAMLVERPDGVVTGGGVTLCIDTTLHLLADMLGERVATRPRASSNTAAPGEPIARRLRRCFRPSARVEPNGCLTEFSFDAWCCPPRRSAIMTFQGPTA